MNMSICAKNHIFPKWSYTNCINVNHYPPIPMRGFRGINLYPPLPRRKIWEEQPLPHWRGAYLTDKCRKENFVWSLPDGFLWGPLAERRHVPAYTANELCLPGQGAATLSIKGQTVNILSFTSHLWSLPQILMFILCVFWFVVNNL